MNGEDGATAPGPVGAKVMNTQVPMPGVLKSIWAEVKAGICACLASAV